MSSRDASPRLPPEPHEERRRRRARHRFWRQMDPMFAATLINQIAAAETVQRPPYAAPASVRCGLIVDIRT